jgi:hypothetical protein
MLIINSEIWFLHERGIDDLQERRRRLLCNSIRND